MFCYSFSDCVRKGAPVGIAKYTQSKSEKIHTHSFTEIVYIEKGKTIHYIDGKSFEMPEGSLIYIKPFSSHEIEITQETTYIDIYCENERNDSLKGLYYFDGDMREQLESVLNNMYKEYVNASVLYEDILKEYYTIILSFIVRQQQLTETHIGDDKTSAQKIKLAQKLQEIASYVRSNPQKSLSLQELAEKYHYSASYLSRSFTALFGVSYTAYVYRQRFQRVCYLIKETDTSVDCLLEEYKISDISRFYKDFKTEYLMTPQQYRLHLRMKASKK